MRFVRFDGGGERKGGGKGEANIGRCRLGITKVSTGETWPGLRRELGRSVGRRPLRSDGSE